MIMDSYSFCYLEILSQIIINIVLLIMKEREVLLCGISFYKKVTKKHNFGSLRDLL